MAEIVNGASINETHANVNRSRSTFPLKQIVMDTHRFGEYHPHFVLDGVTSDKLPFRCAHSARSYTLKAPLMQDIQMHKDYFLVTQRAILPFQGDRIITNPTIGDDVPSGCYTSVSNFVSKIQTFILTFEQLINAEATAASPDLTKVWTLYFKYLVFLESIFSDGSLASSLGSNLCPCLEMVRVDGANVDAKTIDDVFDVVCGLFVSSYYSTIPRFRVTVDGTGYFVYNDKIPFEDDTLRSITFREFLMRIRDTSDWSINGLSTYNVNIWTSTSGWKSSFVGGNFDWDYAPLVAYQLSCAAFYSDDKVDYIYDAELYREYIHHLIIHTLVPSSTNFTWNGLSLPYDWLSSHFMDEMLGVDIYTASSDSIKCCLQYFISIFGYKRSLRFKDYFTGARTRPLAVGNTNIPVSGGNVSVVDVSRSIQVQRFLNAVQATGRKFEEYLKGIFGVAPSPDHHNPLFLAHTSDSLFASEVENTGVAQQTQPNSVTAVFRGNGSQYEFTVDVDEPCIIIGITSYDIERAYMRGIERRFFNKDRYDMFLPQLQYVGDQDIRRRELYASAANTPFGYTFRDMQYKQLRNRAAGGFASGALPGYGFIYGRNSNASFDVISPDFIRSKCVELDEFYLSLTGFSLATYFHFIVYSTNIISASRPMAVNPQILG